ncbi:MAG: glycosyltransferase family 2 protein [Bacteroidetes bacterium]|nr:glycosyltransferase family 2 protein [Bacteroidota bacterium]
MGNSRYDISIILVNYKTPVMLRNCIASVYAETPTLHCEVIVVDNDSQDESEALIKANFPEVVWINSGYNAGFARANNIGIRRAQAPYCLMLNSDTIVKDNAIEKSLRRYQQYEATTSIGLLGCRIVHFDGYTQYNSNTEVHIWDKLIKANPIYIALFKLLCRRDPATDKNLVLERRGREHEIEHESMWLGGAFLLFNKNLVAPPDLLLDEDFFMYAEDEEWALRLRRKGLHHYFYPHAYILHAEGGSFTIKESKYKQILLSELLLVMKVYGKLSYIAYVLLAIINLICDDLLYWKNKSRLKDNPDQSRAAEVRQWQWQLIRRYFVHILLRYASRPSSAAQYLKNGD